ncbi:ribosome small subunit-dependent GTPase A [Dehalogenimonas sp. THU2]|uniref:ribosome small subunit-dependent GTPase A n=1 Tax=Dehalogenimonas sp. THU2 TaxID=3151121 RepID=UPI00321876A3
MNIDQSENQLTNLDALGWDSFFQQHFQNMEIPDSVPARVSSESKGSFQAYSRYGEFTVKVTGKMRRLAEAGEDYPAVGDWVVINPLPGEQKGMIQAVLPRKSKFSRRAAGERTEEQVVSANVDTVFIVSGLDGGRSFNLRRIERYLTLAWNSGATPAIVLNKIDVCSDVDAFIRAVEDIAPGVSVHPVSARNRIGLDALKKYLSKGKTAAFLGSSGAGKSALINALLGQEKQETGDVRQDDRMGRHTTTRRELILLPGGGVMIDTPGMREIQMWAGEEDLQGAFHDIETLARECRFNDCSHSVESGCAVRAAIERGELDSGRLEGYLKIQKEIVFLDLKEEGGTRLVEKTKFKPIAKLVKEMKNRP